MKIYNKFYISKLKDNSCLVWSTNKTIFSKSWIYMGKIAISDNFKDNYNFFKISDKIYKLTQGMQVIKLNFNKKAV